MSQQNIYQYDTIVLIVMIVMIVASFLSYRNYFFIEGFDCHNPINKCINFQKCCVGNKDKDCRNQDLVGCQKFKFKCENKCKVKQLNDDGNTEPVMEKCVKTCHKVERDCCQRLSKYYNKNNKK